MDVHKDFLAGLFHQPDKINHVAAILSHKAFQKVATNEDFQIYLAMIGLARRSIKINRITIENEINDGDNKQRAKRLVEIENYTWINSPESNAIIIFKDVAVTQNQKLGSLVQKTDNLEKQARLGSLIGTNANEALVVDQPETDLTTELLDEGQLVEFKNNPFFMRYLRGVMKKNLTTIGAESGCLKTTISIAMTIDFLMSKYKVLIIPTDGARREYVAKLVSYFAKVNVRKIVEYTRTEEKPYGDMTREEFELVKQYTKQIQEEWFDTGLLIIDERVDQLYQIEALLHKVKPDVCIVDTIQGMKGPGEISENPAIWIPTVLKYLKLASRLTNTAIIPVSWMNAGSDKPVANSFYQSKSFQKWSQKIWMLYYYHNFNEKSQFRNILEIIDGKQRFSIKESFLSYVLPEYTEFDLIPWKRTDNIIKNYFHVTK